MTTPHPASTSHDEADVARLRARAAFLAAQGLAGAPLQPLAADASFRRYYRIGPEGERPSLVLMDAPPPMEDVRPFLAVARVLANWGLHAPDILAADTARGFVLLEDLGDALFTRLLARPDPERERMLYEAAVEVLVALAERSAELPDVLPLPEVAEGERHPHPLRPYDHEPQWAELALFPEWYLPLVGRPADRSELTAFQALWEPLIAETCADCRVLTLRDYHADNLIWIARARGLRRVGLLDFQDALRGHPAYDLVSLLQDARRDVPPALEKALRTRFVLLLQERRLWPAGIAGRRLFARHYALLGAQRATKIIGIFARLWRRDGKSRYLSMIPRVWGLLERNLAAADLADLAAWYDRLVPPALRRRSPEAKR